MTYKVTLNIDAMVDVVVEADSPEEAFEKASFQDANIRCPEDIDVMNCEPMHLTEEDGHVLAYSA